MAKIKLDLHEIFNRGEKIDAAVEEAVQRAVDERVPTVEIIPGKGSGQLKKRVQKLLNEKRMRALYHRVENDSKNSGRLFVHFRH